MIVNVFFLIQNFLTKLQTLEKIDLFEIPIQIFQQNSMTMEE